MTSDYPLELFLWPIWGDYYIFSNLRTETGEATSAKIYKYSAYFRIFFSSRNF